MSEVQEERAYVRVIQAGTFMSTSINKAGLVYMFWDLCCQWNEYETLTKAADLSISLSYMTQDWTLGV